MSTTNTFRFACPNCSQHLSAEAEHIGQTIECPACSSLITVPKPLATREAAPAVRGPDEKLCKSCGAAIKKLAVICPKCGIGVKKSGAARAGFWINMIFGFFGVIGGGCSNNFSRLSEALGGETVPGVAMAGGILFWASVVALVAAFKIKNSKPIGWKLSTFAAVGCFVIIFVGPNMQSLAWAFAYGLSAFLSRKDLASQNISDLTPQKSKKGWVVGGSVALMLVIGLLAISGSKEPRYDQSNVSVSMERMAARLTKAKKEEFGMAIMSVGVKLHNEKDINKALHGKTVEEIISLAKNMDPDFENKVAKFGTEKYIPKTTEDKVQSKKVSGSTLLAGKETFGINDVVDFDDSSWIVLDARELGSKIQPNNTLFENQVSEGRFIYVRFKVVNKTNKEEAIAFSPAVRDSKGRRYEEFEKTEVYLPEGETGITLEPLPASLSKTFSAIFEVPKDSEEIVFLARSLAFIGKTEKAIALNLEKAQAREAEMAAAAENEQQAVQEAAEQEKKAREAETSSKGSMSRANQTTENRGPVATNRGTGALSADQESRRRQDVIALADATNKLSEVDAKIASDRKRWQNATAIVNRETNNMQTPVQMGTAAYVRYSEATRIIQEVERGATGLKEQKIHHEAVIKSLKSPDTGLSESEERSRRQDIVTFEEATGKLADIEASLVSSHKKWTEAKATINKLTNNMRTPIQQGTITYIRYTEAERVAKEMETNETTLKQQKTQQEAIIKSLKPMAKTTDTQYTSLNPEIARIDARLAELQKIYDQQNGNINRLTNFKRKPIQKGTPAYDQFMEADAILRQVTAEAKKLKDRKTALMGTQPDLVAKNENAPDQKKDKTQSNLSTTKELDPPLKLRDFDFEATKQKSVAFKGKTPVIKGFYLGMPGADAQGLINHYLNLPQLTSDVSVKNLSPEEKMASALLGALAKEAKQKLTDAEKAGINLDNGEAKAAWEAFTNLPFQIWSLDGKRQVANSLSGLPFARLDENNCVTEFNIPKEIRNKLFDSDNTPEGEFITTFVREYKLPILLPKIKQIVVMGDEIGSQVYAQHRDSTGYELTIWQKAALLDPNKGSLGIDVLPEGMIILKKIATEETRKSKFN